MIVLMKNVRRLHNSVAAGKQPVGVLSPNQKIGFKGFAGFVTKKN